MRRRRKDNSLRILVEDMVIRAKELCPDARVEISYAPIEEKDAVITVYCPKDWDDKKCWNLQGRLSDLRMDILLNQGYSILPLVIEDQERVRAENEEYRKSLKKIS